MSGSGCEPREEEEDLLSREEAFGFLEKVGVKNGEELVNKDQLVFLNAVIAACMTHLPFQSVSMLAVKQEERRVPSLREVVEAGLSLEGGVCFTLNIFMCILLRALDLHAHVLDGSYSASVEPHTHVVVLVKDLGHPGNDYIVDVGCGFPFLEAVPLASLPVIYHQAGLEYTYTRSGDTVARLHRDGDERPTHEINVMVGDWRQVFHFNLSPVEYEFFYSHMKFVYINEDCHFLQVLVAVRFPPADLVSAENNASENTYVTGELSKTENNTAYQECKENSSDKTEGVEGTKSCGKDKVLLAIRDKSLLVGPMCNVTKTKMEDEVWPDLLKKHFPTIPPAKIDHAVRIISAFY